MCKLTEDILYTPEEIAQKLKITKGTVYEMIKRGELEAHRIGRYLRISRTQFDKYLPPGEYNLKPGYLCKQYQKCP